MEIQSALSYIVIVITLITTIGTATWKIVGWVKNIQIDLNSKINMLSEKLIRREEVATQMSRIETLMSNMNERIDGILNMLARPNG